MAPTLVACLWFYLLKKLCGLTTTEIIKIAILKFGEMGLTPIIEKGEMHGFSNNEKADENSNTVEFLVRFMKARGKSVGDIINELDYFGIPWVPSFDDGFMSVHRARELVRNRSNAELSYSKLPTKKNSPLQVTKAPAPAPALITPKTVSVVPSPINMGITPPIFAKSPTAVKMSAFVPFTKPLNDDFLVQSPLIPLLPPLPQLPVDGADGVDGEGISTRRPLAEDHEPKRQKTSPDDPSWDEPVDSFDIEDISEESINNKVHNQQKTVVGLYANGASRGRLERMPIETIMRTFGAFKYRVNTEKRNRIGIVGCSVRVLVMYSDAPDINPAFDFPAIGILDGDEAEPDWMKAKNCVVTLRYDYVKQNFINMTPEVKLRITQLFMHGD